MREEIDMVTNVIATPVDSALPTVGPWTIECSDCGPIGVANTTASADRALISHAVSHAEIRA